jgi:DNA repair protein RadC
VLDNFIKFSLFACMTNYVSIKNRQEDERPREKILQHGISVLSHAELLGILIGTGTRSKSAVDLGREILHLTNQDLNQLNRMSIQDFCQVNGIGPAKAINITAALELGKRLRKTDVTSKGIIRCSKDAYTYLGPHLENQEHEEFWMLLLKQSNEIIQAVRVSSGGWAGTVADPKLIYKTALQHKASAVIFSHNHPSGNLKPSNADLQLTKKLMEAGELLDIRVVDHVIISDKGYFSFADEGLI